MISFSPNEASNQICTDSKRHAQRINSVFVDRQSCPYFFSSEVLDHVGISTVESIEDSEVIVTSTFRDSLKYITRFRANKSYVIWCDEPLWVGLDAINLGSAKRFSRSIDNLVSDLKIEVISPKTGDVFFSNYHFLTSGYLLDKASVAYFLNKYKGDSLVRPKNCAAFLTYRRDDRYEFNHGENFHSLNQTRVEIAQSGHRLGSITIYGSGWPTGISMEDSRTQDNWAPWARKLDILSGFKYSLCLENTYCPYYVSEKIWHGILANTVPVYYAPSDSTIFQDFDSSSFINLCDFPNYDELFSYMKSMASLEYGQRLDACKDSLLRALARSAELDHQSLRLRALRGRLNSLGICSENH